MSSELFIGCDASKGYADFVVLDGNFAVSYCRSIYHAIPETGIP